MRYPNIKLSVLWLVLLCAVTSQAAEPLRHAAEVLALSPGAAREGRPVELRGVVTYVKPGGYVDLVIQDETAGIFVGNTGKLPPLDLKPGMVLEVKGRTTEGNYAPTVNASAIASVSTVANLPIPRSEPRPCADRGRVDKRGERDRGDGSFRWPVCRGPRPGRSA